MSPSGIPGMTSDGIHGRIFRSSFDVLLMYNRSHVPIGHGQNAFLLEFNTKSFQGNGLMDEQEASAALSLFPALPVFQGSLGGETD